MASTDLKKRDMETLARPLPTLVPLIRRELEAGDAAGIEHYRKAGEMLIEAKEQCQHGEWTAWVERNFHLNIKSAQKYMRLAETSKTKRATFTTLSAAVEPDRHPGHRPAWQAPVQKAVNALDVEAIRADFQSKVKEDRLIKELALQLIDIGYKVLASKLHPDKGGSAEAMARLNKVKALLKGAV